MKTPPLVSAWPSLHSIPTNIQSHIQLIGLGNHSAAANIMHVHSAALLRQFLVGNTASRMNGERRRRIDTHGSAREHLMPTEPIPPYTSNQYHFNRHNVGMLFLDWLLLNFKQPLPGRLAFEYRPDLQSDIANVSLTNHSESDASLMVLAKPRCFMNQSGEAVVKKLLPYYNQHGKNTFVIVHDELDKPLGKWSWKLRGSSNGHNGIRSIINHLNSCNEFLRIRIGIGRPDNKAAVSEWVLSDFSSIELYKLESEVFPSIVKSLASEYKVSSTETR